MGANSAKEKNAIVKILRVQSAALEELAAGEQNQHKKTLHNLIGRIDRAINEIDSEVDGFQLD